MKKYGNTVMVYLDSDTYKWLSEKAADGYKKASLIRHMINLQMKAEGSPAAHE